MANRLFKPSDLAQRWVPNLVWVTEGYWVEDPIIIPPDHDVEYPTDPITDRDDPIPQYGRICALGGEYGPIQEGYVQHVTVIQSDPDPFDGHVDNLIYTCWGPP